MQVSSLQFSVLSFARAEDDFRYRKSIDDTIADEVHISFVPGLKSTVPTTTLKNPTDAPGVRLCFSYEFKRVPGRKCIWGRGANIQTATGLTAYCRMLAGRSDPGDLY